MRNLEPAQRTNPKRKILGTNFMVRKFWIRRVKGLTFLLSFGLILHGSTFLPFQEAGAGSQLTTAEVLEQLQAKAETLKSLQGNFEQRKFSRLLITPMESEGRLFWQPPSRLRWEVVQPAPLTLVAQGERIMLLYPDLKKASLYRKSARRARYFKRLEIKIDPKTWLPGEISIQESSEDWTVIHLSNLQENTELSDELFSVQPPKDFHLQKYQGGGRP
jgi:outer membrane lipoprotein-sorting protein